jgi:NADH-quinone oxidoreductase subunit C
MRSTSFFTVFRKFRIKSLLRRTLGFACLFVPLLLFSWGKNGLSFNCKIRQSLKVLGALKFSTNLQYRCLVDAAGLDFIHFGSRLAVSYNLLTIRFNRRIRLIVFLDTVGFLDTVTNLYESGGWLEREIWDLLGVFFRRNFDLRRLLTDYGFEGHPLRKDFPLEGFRYVVYSMLVEIVLSDSQVC